VTIVSSYFTLKRTRVAWESPFVTWPNSVQQGEWVTVKRTAKINGIELFYSDVGDHARNVLLIHGHPFNHAMWQPQMEYLRDNYRVRVPDLRG
jgi:hypothetical protein